MTTASPSADAYDVDHFSRTELILGRQAGDAAEGRARHRTFRLHIIAGQSACASRTGQAAVLTAVATAVRAFSEVSVHLAAPNEIVAGGPHAGERLGDRVVSEGARLVDDVAPATSLVVVVGEAPTGVRPERHWVAATWSGWIASAGPTAMPSDSGDASRNGRDDVSNCVAAIAAAAIAIAEVFFGALRGDEPTSPARQIRLNLWAPDSLTDNGPVMIYAPSQWWLLGLGHLGQGYAHVISWLDYANPSEVQVVLQDTQRAVVANHSTGVLTPADPGGQRKTRIVAAALDRCGFETVIIERRMTARTPAGTEDMHVALVGVDNNPTRRLIDQFRWKTAIDVGLGAGVRDFDGMTMRRLPGQPSAEVPAWQERPPSDPTERKVLAVPGLDACGMAELNGVAVGASFVGVIAGTLAVAEAARVLQGGSANAVVCVDLRDDEVNVAGTATYELPVAAQIR